MLKFHRKSCKLFSQELYHVTRVQKKNILMGPVPLKEKTRTSAKTNAGGPHGIYRYIELALIELTWLAGDQSIAKYRLQKH